MEKANGKVGTTRKELYEMVWSEPLYRAAKKLGISDVGLKKVCKRHGIPSPYLGYWRQKEFGAAAPRPDLPDPENNPVIEISGRGGDFDDPNATPLERKVAGLIRSEHEPENKIVVPSRVAMPHPVARRARELVEENNPGREDTIYKCIPRVMVSEKALPRTTRIIHALIKAMEDRGWYADNEIKIFGENQKFAIREIMNKELAPSSKRRIEKGETHLIDNPFAYHEVPSGRLHLSINNFSSWNGTGLRKNWKDGKRQKLEGCLNDILIGLIRAAEIDRNRAIEREAMHKRWKEEARRREAQLRKTKRLENRESVFLSDAKLWVRTRELSDYLEAIKCCAKESSDPRSADPRFHKWIQWAEAYIKNHDPLLFGRPFRIRY